jgi:hypothetical protein
VQKKILETIVSVAKSFQLIDLSNLQSIKFHFTQDARGYYTSGREMSQAGEEELRRALEKCDSCQGILLFRSCNDLMMNSPC